MQGGGSTLFLMIWFSLDPSIMLFKISTTYFQQVIKELKAMAMA